MTGEDAKQRDTKWSDDSIVIYDDGEVSFIYGKYEGCPRTLGMRWNISEGQFNLGYPNYNRLQPRWLVVPEIIRWSSLLGLLTLVKQRISAGTDVPDNEKWKKRILAAMEQLHL